MIHLVFRITIWCFYHTIDRIKIKKCPYKSVIVFLKAVPINKWKKVACKKWSWKWNCRGKAYFVYKKPKNKEAKIGFPDRKSRTIVLMSELMSRRGNMILNMMMGEAILIHSHLVRLGEASKYFMANSVWLCTKLKTDK